MGGGKSFAGNSDGIGEKYKTAGIRRERGGHRRRRERRGAAHPERTALAIRVRMAMMISVLVAKQRAQIGIAGNDTQVAVGSETRHVAGCNEQARQHQR